MFYSEGKLRYSINPYKLIVEVDPGISNFYRSLVPKHIQLNKQLYPPHISIVRKEIPPNLQFWEKYQGEKISFTYDNYIFNDELYYWLVAYSKQLEEIRLELGLIATSSITESPDGRHKFHITLGNLKNRAP